MYYEVKANGCQHFPFVSFFSPWNILYFLVHQDGNPGRLGLDVTLEGSTPNPRLFLPPPGLGFLSDSHVPKPSPQLSSTWVLPGAIWLLTWF